MSEERRFKRGGKPGRSYLPLAIMILYLVAVRLTIARNPDMFRSAAQANSAARIGSVTPPCSATGPGSMTRAARAVPALSARA